MLVFAADGTQQTTLAVWAWIVALAHQSQAWTGEATRAFPEHVCVLSVSLSSPPARLPTLEQPSHLARLTWLTPLFLDPEALLRGVHSCAPHCLSQTLLQARIFKVL